MPKEITFTVRFKPMVGWVDETYLGNMLIEVLGAMARTTGGFEFEVETPKT